VLLVVQVVVEEMVLVEGQPSHQLKGTMVVVVQVAAVFMAAVAVAVLVLLVLVALGLLVAMVGQVHPLQMFGL
jgi:hypothetical protein